MMATRPVLDPDALRALVADVGDDAAACFASRYAEMLPVRLDRLAAALRDGDSEEGYVVALSLYSSSAMVGAAALTEAAYGAAVLLRAGDIAGACAAMTNVYTCSEATLGALGARTGR